MNIIRCADGRPKKSYVPCHMSPALHCLILKPLVAQQTDKHMGIVTYRLKRHRGRFSENVGTI